MRTLKAGAGDLIRLPMGSKHGIFNRSAANTRALFWVAPSRRLYDLFVQIDKVADPAEVVRIAAEYNIHFLPPPADRRRCASSSRAAASAG